MCSIVAIDSLNKLNSTEHQLQLNHFYGKKNCLWYNTTTKCNLFHLWPWYHRIRRMNNNLCTSRTATSVLNLQKCNMLVGIISKMPLKRSISKDESASSRITKSKLTSYFSFGAVNLSTKNTKWEIFRLSQESSIIYLRLKVIYYKDGCHNRL